MGSKSGGGDPAAYQRELRAEQDKAIAKLNSLFGVDDGTQTIDRNAFYKPAADAGQQQPITPEQMVGTGLIARMNQPQGVFDDVAYQKALEDYRAGQSGVAADRSRLYDTMGADIYNQQKYDLDQQQQKAARALKFAIAGRGMQGSSVDIDQNAELARNYQRGITDLANNRISAANNARAADEQTRLDLVGRIRAGMDQASAINSATSQMQSNIAQQRDAGLAASLKDYFGGMGYLNQQAQYQKQFNNTYRTPSTVQAQVSNGVLGRY